MAQSYYYPPSGSIQAVGVNGSPIPADSILIGGTNPGGNLTPVSVDNTGAVNIATSSTLSMNLAQVGGAAISEGQKTMANSLPVVVASDQSAVAISAASLPLPSGAATSANQTNASQKTQVVNSSGTSVDAKTLATQVVSTDVGIVTNTVIHGLNSGGGGTYVDVKVNPSGALVVDGSGSTQPVSGTVTANQGGTWNINNISGTISLPTNASTSALQTTGNTSLSSIDTKTPSLGQAVMASSSPVVIASNQSAVATTSSGTAQANAPVYNDYSSVNVTTSAYTQLVASTSNIINCIHIFDSSGQGMILATGGAGVEVDQLYIAPGGDTYLFNIPASTRISYKAKTATANTGYLLMSFLK